MKIIKIIVIYVFFSLSLSMQIIDLNGNITSFSMMYPNSNIEKNIRGDDKDNLIGFSFIQLPSDINYKELFHKFKHSDFIFSERIAQLDFGTLFSFDNDNIQNEFFASEQLIEISAQKKTSSNFSYRVSLGYIFSKIERYSSSLFFYNIGINKEFINRGLSFGLSKEKNTKILNQYSNLGDDYQSQYRLNMKYALQYLPLDLFLSYIIISPYTKANSNFTLGCDVRFTESLKLFIGKSYHLLNNNIENTLFHSTALGIAIIDSDYKLNIGMQVHNEASIYTGASLIYPFD